jgi:hypothetical protein
MNQIKEKYESNSKIIIEENFNYGHKNIIWKGNVEFPPHIKDEKSNKEDDLNYFNKQSEIKKVYDSGNIKIIDNEEEYFKLYRYGVGKLNKPNDDSGPTLCIVLFMPNSSLKNKDFSKWTGRYLQNQLTLCIAFNYFFPENNIRVYFDKYMLDKFQELDGDDNSLIVTKQINEFHFYDFEDKEQTLYKLLKKFYEELKKYDNYKFTNGMERFLFQYNLACKTYFKDSELIIKDKTADFFVYKLGGPFIENKGTVIEGHITDGYVGQLIRYLSLKQTNYLWNDYEIKKPNFLMWRDAHAACMATLDYQWIKSISSSIKDEEIYFLLNTSDYIGGWHDKAKCDIDGKFYKRSTTAGICQIINSKINENDLLYLQTIGMAFIINNKNELPLRSHRHTSKHYSNGQIVGQYQYGIEEYVLTSFFIIPYIKKRHIMFNLQFIGILFDAYQTISYENPFISYVVKKALLLLLYYMKQLKYINENEILTREKIINYLEILRNDDPNKHNNLVKLLLNIIPNKYQITQTIFNTDKDALKILKEEIGTISEIIDYFCNNKEFYKILFYDINSDNLKKLGILCETGAYARNVVEWCQNPYSNIKNGSLNCVAADYYSGFYKDIPPSLGIGILRNPDDFKQNIEIILKNRLIMPLNKTNYKLNIENRNLCDKLKKSGNIDTETGEINLYLIHLIYNYGNPGSFLSWMIGYNYINGEYIYKKAILLDDDIEFDNYIKITTALIWKSLNYYGYDIEPNWFRNIKLSTDEKYKIFNEYVIELSNITNWGEYAIYILLNDNSNKEYYKDIVDFETEEIIKYSNQYNEVIEYKFINEFNDYKMSLF